MMNTRFRRAQTGFTLIEFIIVVALIIAAGILVFLHSESAKVTAAVNKEVSSFSTASGRIKSLFSGKGNFVGINNAMLVGARVFSHEFVTGTDVRNSWGGTVVVTSTTLGGRPNMAYAWTTSTVPQAECIDLVNALDNLVLEVRVNSVVVKPYLGTLDKTLLADPTACAASATFNEIVLVAAL